MMRGVDEIQAAARSFVGVPFVHQGRSRAGCDCVGLLILVANAIGVETVDRPYPQQPPEGMLPESLEANGLRAVPIERRRFGDVVSFRFRRRYAQHAGILVERGGEEYLVHAYRPAGAVVEHVLDRRWRRLAVEAWRFWGDG
jgi:cell wall-associated NlpC family hydrolase